MILDKFSLTGKNAIVTGARTGIGQAMAIGLAEAGANIIGVGRTPMPETQSIIEGLGREFLYIQADLSQQNSIAPILSQSLEKFKHLDILVNNAGIVRRATIEEIDEKAWDETMQVNLKSVFFLSQLVAKQFLKQKTGGKIINISSLHGYRGGTSSIAYNASKFGIEGITRSMAKSWAKHKINCNTISPGYTITDINPRFTTDPIKTQETISKTPAERLGLPEDFKGAIVFLGSDASDFIHGATLNVDGGWLA